MLPSNEILNPTNSQQVLPHVVPFPVVRNEQSGHPDFLVRSLQRWKVRLEYLQEEITSIKKIVKWHEAKLHDPATPNLNGSFEHLTQEGFHELKRTVAAIENQIIAALLNQETQTIILHKEIYKIEKLVEEFNEAWIPAKLKVLKIIANNPPITFF